LRGFALVDILEAASFAHIVFRRRTFVIFIVAVGGGSRHREGSETTAPTSSSKWYYRRVAVSNHRLEVVRMRSSDIIFFVEDGDRALFI
jgi:hypothetical protein